MDHLQGATSLGGALDEPHPRNHVPAGVDGSPLDGAASAVMFDGQDSGDSVAGWIMVHRLAANTGRVSAGWVHPDRVRGFAYGARVAHTSQPVFDQGEDSARFVVHPYETGMAVFAERRITRFASRIRESMECLRALA